MTKKIAFASEVRVSTWAPDAYQALVERETNEIPDVFTLPTIHGRKRWLISLPACVLKLDSSSLSPDVESDLVQVALARRHETPLGFFRPRKEVTLREGQRFYSAFFLEQLGPFLALPATVAALAAFVRAADRGVVKVGKIAPKGPEEFSSAAGHGRLWQPWEDTVLRNWFGPRTYGEHQGRHVPLTEEQWQLVLQTHLQGRRTKKQVKVRITTLNRELRISFLVDGFLPRDRVREFQERALGEHRIRAPKFRPRIKGRSYRGDHERPVLGQPL